MEFNKKVIKIGSSLGIVLDKLIIKTLKIKKGDVVSINLYNKSVNKSVNKSFKKSKNEIKKAFAPKNHQRLTIEENLVKGGKYGT